MTIVPQWFGDFSLFRLTPGANLMIVILTIPAKPRVGSLAPDTAQIGGLLFSGGRS